MDAMQLAALGLGTAGVYGVNAIVDENERPDRTAVNTAGNIIGGIGSQYIANSIPGGNNPYARAAITAAGILGGGYISDRIADLVDPTQGKISPTVLLNAHLEDNPMGQEAMYLEKIRQARLMKREMEKQQMLEYRKQMEQQMEQQQMEQQ